MPLDVSAQADSFDTLSFLEQFGLTRLEARTYLSLLSQGQARASALAESTGVIRPTIYRVLDQLAEKGLVRKSLTTPAVYSASDPKNALRALLANATTKIERLSSMLGEALYTLYSNAPSAAEPAGEFKLIPDRKRLEPTLADMIERSQSTYSAIYSKWGLARVTEDSPEGRALVEAAKRGVQIRIVSEIEASNAKVARLLRTHTEIRNTKGIGFYLALRDENEVMIGPMLTDGEINHDGQNVDLWANNCAFARAMRDLYEKIWAGSVPMNSNHILNSQPARRAG